MTKRIVVVHGRSTKPRKEEKERLVTEALCHGLERVSGEAAGKVRSGEIGIDLIYYGDINNAILWASEQRPPKKFVADFLNSWNFPYEPDGRYDEPLHSLFSWKTANQNKSAYKRLRRQVRDQGFVDNILDVISPVLNLIGLNDEVLNSFLPDMNAYFKYRMVGSMIRESLQKKLKTLLQEDADVCLISHSMGTIVAYDVLWKFSRMSEYSDIRDKKVQLFMTLGSPLGDPVITKQLYDSNEPEDGKFPTNINVWKNFSAQDDFISRDEQLADNFSVMVKRKFVSRITDEFIYTFWVDKGELNPHKLYGYLDHNRVAKAIAGWIG